METSFLFVKTVDGIYGRRSRVQMESFNRLTPPRKPLELAQWLGIVAHIVWFILVYLVSMNLPRLSPALMDWYVREVENGDMALAYIAVVTILFLVVGGLGGFPLRRLVERAVRAPGAGTASWIV